MTERERDLLNENEQLRLTIQGAMWVLRFVAEHDPNDAFRLMARQVIDAHNPGTYPEAGAVNASDFLSPVANSVSAEEVCPC